MLDTEMGERMKYQKDTKSSKWTFDERTATSVSQLKPVNLYALASHCMRYSHRSTLVLSYAIK